MDINNAFLPGDLHTIFYKQPSPGFSILILTRFVIFKNYNMGYVVILIRLVVDLVEDLSLASDPGSFSYFIMLQDTAYHFMFTCRGRVLCDGCYYL